MTRFPRLIATIVRTMVVAGVASLLVLGPAQGSASAAVGGLTKDDIKLVELVHQASLVEIWAGKRAKQFSSTPAIRWVGQNLFKDHAFLEKEIAKASSELEVPLPKEPTLQQQAGMRKIARVTGAEFDRAFANALHFGHTDVLKVAQRVVAENSKNPVVRQMGQLGVNFVSKHIAWLEATGLVTAASSVQASAQVPVAQETAGVKPYSNVVPLMLGLGSIGTLLLTVAYLVLRPRRAEIPASRDPRGDPREGRRGSPRVPSHAR